MDKKNKVLFITAGDLGDLLVKANYLFYLWNYFDSDDIVFAVASSESNDRIDCVFSNLPFIPYRYSIIHPNDFDNISCDVMIELGIFPDVIKVNKKITSKKLRDYISMIELFKTDIVNEFYYRNKKTSFPYVYRMLINQHKNMLNSLDIFDFLKIDKNGYHGDLYALYYSKKILSSTNCQERYVLIVNPRDLVLPNNWGDEKYSSLSKRLTKNIKVIMLRKKGEKYELDKKSINILDVCSLVKNAFLMISNDCELVHLRKALNGGPSVVLFGNSSIEFNGYSDNINLRTDACKYWCEGLADNNDINECCREDKNVLCMNSLTVDFVLNSIECLL